jgi:hypothetical protein
MNRRLLIVVGALSLLGGIAQGTAGASPTPSYSASCMVGGNTTGDWQRAKVVQVDFDWFGSAGSSEVFETVTVQVGSKGHHGSVFSTTLLSANGVAPASVRATFTQADGTTVQAEADCK